MHINNPFFKYLGIYSEILKSRLLNKRIPIIANILILNRCNLKCFYCYPDVFNRNIEDMSLENFKKIIDILHSKGTKLVFLLGGEPLLRDDLSQFVDYVTKKGMFCEVVTNGYFVRQRLGALKKADSVCVSIDGDEESHDKNRGRGSYKKAIDAIDILLAYKIHTRIKAVVTKNNLNAVEFLASLAKEKGLVLMAITPNIYEGRNYPAETKNLWLNKDEYRIFIQKLIRLKKQGYPIFHSFAALNYCFRWPYEFHQIMYQDKFEDGTKIISCSAPKYHIFIDVDGRFFAPCLKAGDIQGKSLLETDFEEWWVPHERFGCKSCAVLPNIEKSLIYNFNPEAIFNMAKMSFVKNKLGSSSGG